MGYFWPKLEETSKLEEIHGKEMNTHTGERVEAVSDSDWAGDKSNTMRRRHSISSGMVFVNGRLVTPWSRTQKSIALSSCESEFLASASAGAEALYIGRLWNFFTQRETEVSVITDSSSGKTFTQRLGVGRIKHVDVK